MNGDFSRDSFDPRRRFSRVLLQQGRVLLDADWNEQASIFLHYLRSLAADLIGPHGGPGDGFRIIPDGDRAGDFVIGAGHYYVDGILCENQPAEYCRTAPPPQSPPPGPPPVTYTSQPYLRPAAGELGKNLSYVVYLDVWERPLSQVEEPELREVALGGADTAARAQVVWQVRAINENEFKQRFPDDAGELTCNNVIEALTKPRPCCMRARARVPAGSDEPCIIPPEAQYRGGENQLYRVEIHRGSETPAGATFKWSRDNGSVAFPVRSFRESVAVLDTLGPDERRSLREGDWVEVLDDELALAGRHGLLARVGAVDRVRYEVRLALRDGSALPEPDGRRTHPLLRRWDQGTAAIPVRENRWLDLEDGVQVFFEPGGSYRTGDYWLIPARTATGDVLWPTDESVESLPLPLPPRGIEHHYAPLGKLTVDGTGVVTLDDDCRCSFEPLCGPRGPRKPQPPPSAVRGRRRTA